MMRLLKDTIAIILLLFTIAVIFIARVANPTYTEIQLFVYLYPLWMLCGVLISVAWTLFTFKRN